MDLLHHFLTGSDMLYPLAVLHIKPIVMKYALGEPFLMHQVLALSARHLSVIRPQNPAFYITQAIQLQTHALALFNAKSVSDFEISLDSRMPGYLFSGLLAFHALCDMLSHRDDDFSATHARFVGYLNLQRGVHQLMKGHIPSFMQSEVRPMLDVGIRWTAMQGDGPECDDIRGRIETAGLDPETTKYALHAVGMLQGILDGRLDPISSINALAAWGVMIQDPFVDLIRSGRPEGLVILA